MKSIPIKIASLLCLSLASSLALHADEAADKLLLTSAQTGDYAGATEALGSGANVACKDIFLNTPIILAAREGRHNMIALLLSRGAPINDTNQADMSALSWATFHYNYRSVALLLSRGAEIFPKFSRYIPHKDPLRNTNPHAQRITQHLLTLKQAQGKAANSDLQQEHDAIKTLMQSDEGLLATLDTLYAGCLRPIDISDNEPQPSFVWEPIIGQRMHDFELGDLTPLLREDKGKNLAK
jgi:ankyrin repeat protein